MPDWKKIRESSLAENSEAVLPPSVELPVLPKALMEFRKQCEDPDAENKELARIIGSDAGLSAELLRNANVCYGGSRTKVTSISQALVVLGIRSALLHLSVSGMRQVMKSSSSKLINFQNFWNANLERSFFAREIAELLGADKELAFTAGMLQDFLLPLITNQMFDDYVEFTTHRDDFTNLVSFEQQRFKWDHAQVAAQVMHSWQFPDELVCCVYYHHQGLAVLKDERLAKTSAAAVAISSLLPDAFRQETNGLEKLFELEREWPELDLLTVAEKVNDNFLEMAGDVRNHFPFIRTLQNKLKRMALVEE